VTGYEALVDGAAWVETESLQAVELTGADVQEWLQGQVTQDLRGVLPGGFCRACLCRATGQLEAVLKFWCLPGRWLALTEAPQAVLGRVQSYVILEDVQAKVLGSSVIGVFGPLADLAVGSPETGWLRADEGWFGIDQRPPTVHQADREAYQTWLLERGVPIFGVDTTERTLPPELGPRFDSTHVAYEKGCYVGQEVLQRIHSRGHTNRTWVCLKSEAPLLAGSTVSAAGRTDVGSVTRTARSPRFGSLAGAFVRNEHAAPGSEVNVCGVSATVADWPA
jgi:tRNA-modifying protein YgfZ